MKRNQSGMTLLSFVMVLAVAGFAAYIAMRLFPMYQEFWSVKKALQETGFHNIVKLIGDMAFDANGVIDDKARVDALRKLIPAANNQITVSPLEQLSTA